MTSSTVAAKVAADKEKHPERYCPVKGCLWRAWRAFSLFGQITTCPKHPAKGK